MADHITYVDSDTSLANRVMAAWFNQVNKWTFWGRKPGYATTTGSANAQILTLETGSLYSTGTEADGDSFRFTAGFTNTTAMTMQIIPPAGANTARAAQINGQALVGGEVQVGQTYEVTRLGTTWQLTQIQQLTDGTPLVVNSADITKKLRFALSSITTATTRVITWADSNLTFASIAAKGDSWWGSAAGTLSTLTVGANDTFPIADSAQTPGVKWGTVTSFTEDTSPDLAADFTLTYDVSAATSKKVLLGRVGRGVLVAKQATTSGTSITFTGIPSWVQEIIVMLTSVSTNGTSLPILQIGPVGGVEVSGYLGSTMSCPNAGTLIGTTFTAGFGLAGTLGASTVLNGIARICLLEASSNTWACSVDTGHSDAAQTNHGGFSKPLAGTLTQVRLTTLAGADTFDLGAISLMYR